MFVNICLYQINCPTISSMPKSKVLPPIPIVNLFYGPNIANAHVIARPVSHPGPIVECSAKGEAKVIMQVTAADPNIVFAHDLFDATDAKPLPNRVIQSFDSTSNGIELTFHVRAPKSGNFALAIYSNIDNIGSGKFLPFCYYLVSSKNQTGSVNGFPDVPNDVVGAFYPKFSQLSLSIKSCVPSKISDWKNGMIKTDEDGEVMLFLGHEKLITILTDFNSSANPGNSLNRYTCVESTGLVTCIIARTPSKDYSNAPFVLKMYAADMSHSQQIPSVYTAIIFPHSGNIEAEEFAQSPTRFWGPAGPQFFKFNITGLSFAHSTSHIKDKCQLSDFVANDPVRIYKGGEDCEITLSSVNPLQLKTKLQQLSGQAAQQQDLDHWVCLYKADTKSASIKLRVPTPGTYLLAIYGSLLDDHSGQLTPLIYFSITATKASQTTSPFPTAFGLWASSARVLHSPLSPALPRNKETLIKVYLAKFQKSKTAEATWEAIPYPDVLFVVDGAIQVKPKSASDGTYEWKYAPGPGEKVAGVLAKTEPSSQSMAYALQFQIE